MERALLILLFVKLAVTEFAGVDRPCPQNEIECIRSYFASHARCQPVQGDHSNEVLATESYVILPYPLFNATGICQGMKFVGPRQISDFFIDPVNNNAVLTLTCAPMTIYSNNSILIYNNLGMEPIISTDVLLGTIASVQITAVIPNIKNLQMKHAFITAYTPNATADIVYGPGISSDPLSHARYLQLGGDQETFIRYSLGSSMPYLLRDYVDVEICNFKNQNTYSILQHVH